MSTKAVVFLADGFEEIEAVTPIDVLRREGVNVITVTINETKKVTGAHRIVMEPDFVFSDGEHTDADVVILPGGMPGTANMQNHSGLCQFVKAHAESGKLTAAICAAPSILGSLGLLQGKTATCYPGWEDKLIGADITDKAVAISENFVTGRGAGVSMDFALALVWEIIGKQEMQALSKKMIFSR